MTKTHRYSVLFLVLGLSLMVTVIGLASQIRQVVMSAGEGYYLDLDTLEVHPLVPGYVLPQNCIVCLEEDAEVELDSSGDEKVLVQLKGPAIWTLDKRYFEKDAPTEFRDDSRRVGEKIIITPEIVATLLYRQDVAVREGLVRVKTIFRDERGKETELFSKDVKAGEKAMISPCGWTEIKSITLKEGAEAEEAEEAVAPVIVDVKSPVDTST